jgi:general secretion pathway protein G
MEDNMRRNGFTLIELMIVVIIIAALAAMIVPRLSGRAEQAKVTVAQSDINANLAMALKLYQLDNGNFPTTEQGLDALITKPGTDPVPSNWNGPYIEKNPIDPWGNTYRYRCPATNGKTSYDLYSLGKDGIEGNEDDVANWKQ